MSRYRKMLHRLPHTFSKKVTKYSAILYLDQRFLQKIYQNLSIVDQVCLSLSCKKLFGLFGIKIKRTDLEFPRLSCIRHPKPCVKSQDVLRNQLLLRLENCRWAYCAKCLKLHPRKEFTRHSLRESALERSCASYAGLADLCPCIPLTIRGRDQLVKILNAPAKPPKRINFPLKYTFSSTGRPGLSHACLTGSRSGYDMRVDLSLFKKENGNLCVLARHTMQFSYPNAHLTARPAFACPHHDLLSFIPMSQGADEPDMNNVPKHRQILLPADSSRDARACPVCETVIVSCDMSEDMNQAVFSVVRNLGSCDWPANRTWLDQCRHD